MQLQPKKEDILRVFEELVGEPPQMTKKDGSGTLFTISPLKDSTLWVELRQEDEGPNIFISMNFFRTEKGAQTHEKKLFGFWLGTWEWSYTKSDSTEEKADDEVVFEFELGDHTFLWDGTIGKVLAYVVSRFPN